MQDQPNEWLEMSGPGAASMAINLHERIDDLEQSLAEERRALRECEARYRELESRFTELQNASEASA